MHRECLFARDENRRANSTARWSLPFQSGRRVSILFLARGKRRRKLRHRFWTTDKTLLDLAAVHRLAFSFLQPFNQRRARAVFRVVTVARDELLAIDRFDERTVLFERTVNEKEAFTSEAT